MLSIAGNDLLADDVKGVIKKGILIPLDEDYDMDEMDKDHDVIIINNTDRVLVLGTVSLRPNGSLPISKDEAIAPAILSAEKDDFITILSDEGHEDYIQRKKSKKKIAKKKKTKKVKEVEYAPPESGEDKEPTAVTWNFKTKETEIAEKVPKSEGFVEVDQEETEDVDFIDADKFATTKKKVAKKKIKKKITKKKATKKKTKKKVKKAKSKKVKTLEPVGEKKLPKTMADAAIELDSRGNPLSEKPGDILRHMIDEIDAGDEIDMVDNEQALDRYRKRTDMD